MQLSAPSSELQQRIEARAADLRHEYEQDVYKHTDRLFALLLALQWVAGIAMAIWLSPWAWRGLDRYVHPHVWAAVFLGGVIAAFPIGLALVRPGETMTRMVIAVAQMLHSALLIHLSGGRIETHFHVFGSLAFLSFYRDWRVLVPATVVVALDHFLRGTFLPESVFGLVVSSPWRWVEHAGWVVFEDIFLVWACVRGSREVAQLALRQAEVESSHERVEAEVARQTQRLELLNQELVMTARRAGMAEIATGVLHNVGNVLNTVNVAASVVGKRLRNSEINSLVKAGEILKSNENDLAAFLTSDERGKHLPQFLIEVADYLGKEQNELIGELVTMERGIEHIKQIVGAQQQHAKGGTFRQKFKPADVFEEAISMHLGVCADQPVEIVRNFAPIGAIALDKHKVLQILINLLSNASKSVLDNGQAQKRISISTSVETDPAGNRIVFQVQDNGVGIARENLAKIFSHGFTTRQGGHGFGLHSAANAAREMDGNLRASSEGPGRGSCFTLELPVAQQSEFEEMVSKKKGAL